MAKLLLFINALLAALTLNAQQMHFVASGSIAADQRDLENETIGGIGSGLAYDAAADVYLAISDRGPGDGRIDYRPRFDTFTLKTTALGLQPTLTATTLLRTTEGAAMSGLTPNVKGSAAPLLADGRRCIDPEAIALAADGTLYIADEYGPFVYQFKRDGTLLRWLEPPANYRPRTAEGAVVSGNQKPVVSGRVPNHGFEGLALSPDSKIATVILQSGLIQDGGKSARFTRILSLEIASGKPVAEYAYLMEDAEEINRREKDPKKDRVKQDDLGISELTAVNDHQFLVLERDNHGANGAVKTKTPRLKAVYLIDLNGATNLLSLTGQPYSQLPGSAQYRPLVPEPGIIPVQKTKLLNFASLLPHNKPLAAKWEGIALTPVANDGHRTMLIACDNDFLNPTLKIAGKTIPFPRAEKAVATTFLEFDLKLP